jgi:hypothetical protein
MPPGQLCLHPQILADHLRLLQLELLMLRTEAEGHAIDSLAEICASGEAALALLRSSMRHRTQSYTSWKACCQAQMGLASNRARVKVPPSRLLLPQRCPGPAWTKASLGTA